MAKNLSRKVLWRGLGIATIIIIGWFLLELSRGRWPDEYYAIRKIHQYRGDYSYLLEYEF